jgi:di/tricarboxylate transporter
VIAVLLGLGVLEIEDVRKLNLLPMFSVVAGISMSEVLVKTQALDILTKSIFNWIGPLFTPPFPWSCVPEP